MKKLLKIAIFLSIMLCASQVFAGVPSGSNWFQLLTNAVTGGDNTGDGGTGNPNDYNYYYVGQTFTATIQINSTGTNAANIWIDYNPNALNSANLLTGTYFPVWSGQTTTPISSTTTRIKSTGYDISTLKSGLGTFGSVQFTAASPTAANYGTNSPLTIDINVGTIGSTTESNISYQGTDILQDAEDFKLHIWADTKKPYASTPVPSNGASGVAVEDNYLFSLIDSKNGEGDNSGTGTGVDTATGTVLFNGVSYWSSTTFVGTGAPWNNIKNATVDPYSPLGIPGDQRNWQYNTTYTVNLDNFKDYASASQNQLGDPNGPNTMNSKTYTFTTEADTIAPKITAETPTRGTSGNSVSTNVILHILDKKFPAANISGSGVNPSTCRINLESNTFASTTFDASSPEVTVTAEDYGYQFIINPATNFGQNEVIHVRVFNCQDTASSPNVMAADNYTFTTSDTDTSFVDGFNPANDAQINKTDSISFHLKDAGTGVDINNTVVYINGEYFTLAGGSGSVTTNGTRITFASSTSFVGSYSGTPSDYAFNINPAGDFVDGESVPIIIYSRDLSGNLMERVVYSVTVSGATCDGSLYCGSNASWNGAKCVGTGGGTSTTCNTSGGGSGTNTFIPSINASTVTFSQVDETSVLVSWMSSIPARGKVVFGTSRPADYGTAPNFGYQTATEYTDQDTMLHTVLLTGLTPGTIYYARPITKANGYETRGSELIVAPKFAQKETCAIANPETPACPVCPTCPTCQKCAAKPGIPGVAPVPPGPAQPGQIPVIGGQKGPTNISNIRLDTIRTDNIFLIKRVIHIEGSSLPGEKVRIIIY